jgi:hypothetical protein
MSDYLQTQKPHQTSSADVLNREVTLKGSIEKSGLSVGCKSRAVAAIDRLIGGVVGCAAEFFEGKRTRAQALNEARDALIRADAAAAVEQFRGMSEFGQVTLARFLRDEYRKQDNRTAIAMNVTELLALPPPAIEHSGDGQDDDQIELDKDWINIFSGYAEQASSERLRDLWGRILAGEIRKPKSFAPATLRVIAEMDSEIAREFEEVYRLSADGFGLRPDPLEGEVLEKFAFLDQTGLTQADSDLAIAIDVSHDGYGYHAVGKFLLRITYQPNETSISFPAIRITRVGKQIGTILPNDEEAALRQIGKSLTEAKKVELCLIGTNEENFNTCDVIDVLHEAE